MKEEWVWFLSAFDLSVHLDTFYLVWRHITEHFMMNPPFINQTDDPISLSQHLRRVGALYMLYVGIFNLVIGLIGNTFIIVVFTALQTFRGNQSAFYLITESISNIALLLGVYLSRILTFLLGFDPVVVSLAWCKIRIMIIQTCGVVSVYAVFFLAFDQCLSTHPRYQIRQRSTLKLAHRLVGYSTVLFILHNITFLIFADIQPTMGCTVYHPLARRYYSFFYYPLLSSSLPMLATIVLSAASFYNVRHLVRLQVPVIRRQLDRQMTAMTLGRVICLFICGFPYLLASVLELNVNNTKENHLQLSIVNMVTSVCYTLLYTNFSVGEPLD